MIYERKDKGCKAIMLAETPSTVLIKAFWRANNFDRRRFPVTEGFAQNILNLSKADFERRYKALT